MNLKLVWLCLLCFENYYLVNPLDLIDTSPDDLSYYVNVKTEKYYCTGILIADNFVITPAFCVNGSSKATVYLECIGDDSEKNEEIHNSSKIVVHDDYAKIGSYHYVNNIALVKLPQPAKLNNNMRPNKLTREQGQLLEGRNVNVSNKMGKYLKFVTTQLEDQDRCSNAYNNQYFRSQNFCLKWFNVTDLGNLGHVVKLDGKIIGFLINQPTDSALMALVLNFAPFLNWMSDKMNIPIEQFTNRENTENECLTELQEKLVEIEKLLREQKTFMDKHIIQEEAQVHSLRTEIKTLNASVNKFTNSFYDEPVPN